MRLIDADRLKEYARKVEDKHLGFLHTVDVSDIDNAPTVEERPSGKWKLLEEGESGFNVYRCSICGHQIVCVSSSIVLYKGCYCGADMRN